MRHPYSASTVALVGFMGAGKTTVGIRLAERLDRPFVDLDALFVEQFGAIEDWFDAHGEPSFREREAQLLKRVLCGPPVVLATGGGVVDVIDNITDLERTCVTVFLDVSLAEAKRRVKTGSSRPVWDQADARFARRRLFYALARHRVNADGSAEAVTERVVAALHGAEDVLADRASLHPVWSSNGFAGLSTIAQLHRYDGLHVVTDDRVGPLWIDGLLHAIGDVPVCVIPNGEVNKTIATWQTVVDHLLAHRVSRRTAVLALGGGVVGDIAGFAASAVNRGVPVLQLPTTTLSMIDSSVGGKTGVNHPAGKNLIGAFHVPDAVWMASDTLTTLEPRHTRAGLAEAVKMALTHDAAAFAFLESAANTLVTSPSLVEAVIRHAVRTKSAVVARDAQESGERRLLNAGHTVGHALERALGYGRIFHGEAVAIGLCTELQWGEARGHTQAGTGDRVARLLTRLGLPIHWPETTDRQAFRAAVTVDKKARRDTLHVPIAREPGVGVLIEDTPQRFADTILELPGL